MSEATCGAAPDFADAHPGYELTFALAGMFGRDEKSIQPTIRPDGETSQVSRMRCSAKRSGAVRR
jgi:hypothetical protein